ncbi:uncharacterized protein EI90DRAFT_3123780 [Cantharellus anzutake]|uniref:uncharacterized protein n=1 Tax=Cantharellus anzutake TaxID=1750568 RepID=UPI001905EB77|nr:uncharacterized protein EI90DRAFT_3123780 [Cantharellus anzutake]KAF8331055.1 hypothetical protein EI90DRAFT_3123780 [Cantharellus anzutake]
MPRNKKGTKQNVLVTNWVTNSHKYIQTGISARKKARLDIQASQEQLLQEVSQEDVKQLEELCSATLGSAIEDWEDEPTMAQLSLFQDEDLDYEQLLSALSSLSPTP